MNNLKNFCSPEMPKNLLSLLPSFKNNSISIGLTNDKAFGS